MSFETWVSLVAIFGFALAMLLAIRQGNNSLRRELQAEMRAGFAQIESRFQRIEADIQRLDKEIQDLKAEIRDMKAGIRELEREIREVNRRVDWLVDRTHAGVEKDRVLLAA